MLSKKLQRTVAFSICLVISAQSSLQAQFVKEHVQQLKTYPFSDANPIPSMAVNNNISRFYPYFMFDGYTNTDTMQKWKVISLDNKHINVTVMPEVGGKVYGAIEKSTGNEFVYLNKVMKFRAIGSRGPWTSGGIEHNFGLDIGHAPWASSPVDYIFRKKADGTVECVVGGLDLASRTQWRMIISLPPDAAYFETKGLWYNPTPYHHSYLSWENAAYKATNDLEFFFPGNYHIDHDGSARTWPIDEEGRDISKYKNNNFGTSKSYHVMGSTRNWFGGLYQNQTFGFGHWAPYADAPGKKLWIWSLARDGAIWEDLLTDKDGQYIEAQSGVKFNQADVVSGYHSPFKQLYLRPGYSESKYEAWFPVKGIKGIDDATAAGSLHVTRTGGSITVAISPNISLADSLFIIADGQVVIKTAINLQTVKVFQKEFSVPATAKQIVVKTKKSGLEYNSSPAFIQRPVKSPDNYLPTDAERLFLLAEDKNSMRLHDEALQLYKDCIKKEPSHTGALTRIAELLYRKYDFDSASAYALRALSINSYYAPANYISGIIHTKKGNYNDAAEAFSVAARSIEFRSEAYRRMAELSAANGEFVQAEEYARTALDYNRKNVPAYQILCAVLRTSGNSQAAAKACAELLEIDPLNHFARFEQYLQKKNAETLKQFRAPIQNEFPHESYLELAVTYYALGMKMEAIQALQLSPSHPMVHYWNAYLQKESKIALELIEKADAMNARFVFPFREESIPVLEHAMSKSKSWKAAYYMALIYWNKGAQEKALNLLNAQAQQPDLAAFYISRAALSTNEQKNEEDYRRALSLEPNEWRTYQYLAEFLTSQGKKDEAIKVWQTIHNIYPKHVVVNLGLAKALLNNNKFKECLNILNNVYVLPQEHANQGHLFYENAHLALAIEHIKNKKWDDAISHLNDARKWPENLGSGEPYDPDNRVADILLAHCASQQGNTNKAAALKKGIIDFTLKTWPKQTKMAAAYIGLNEMINSGQKNKVEEMLTSWQNNADSLQKWGLPGGAGGNIRDYVFKKLANDATANQLEEKILKNENDLTNRLHIEAIRIAYNKVP